MKHTLLNTKRVKTVLLNLTMYGAWLALVMYAVTKI